MMFALTALALEGVFLALVARRAQAIRLRVRARPGRR
jgi:hypothetical protein